MHLEEYQRGFIKSNEYFEKENTILAIIFKLFVFFNSECAKRLFAGAAGHSLCWKTGGGF